MKAAESSSGFWLVKFYSSVCSRIIIMRHGPFHIVLAAQFSEQLTRANFAITFLSFQNAQPHGRMNCQVLAFKGFYTAENLSPPRPGSFARFAVQTASKVRYNNCYFDGKYCPKIYGNSSLSLSIILA
jgi:hypothetical protein